MGKLLCRLKQPENLCAISWWTCADSANLVNLVTRFMHQLQLWGSLLAQGYCHCYYFSSGGSMEYNEIYPPTDPAEGEWSVCTYDYHGHAPFTKHVHMYVHTHVRTYTHTYTTISGKWYDYPLPKNNNPLPNNDMWLPFTKPTCESSLVPILCLIHFILVNTINIIMPSACNIHYSVLVFMCSDYQWGEANCRAEDKLSLQCREWASTWRHQPSGIPPIWRRRNVIASR